jgi:N-acetylated-alpha-linked acidic dipeptidase
MKPIAALAAAVLCLGFLGVGAPDGILRGFGAVDSARERRLEALFLDVPSAQDARETVTAIAAQPHGPGSPGDYATATDMRDRLRQAGINANLEPFHARVDSPRELLLELAPPADIAAAPPGGHRRGRRGAFPVVLDLVERGNPADPATTARGLGTPFSAGSGDGDVRAPLVYAGRGAEADFATLAQAGVDVRGAVLLIRDAAEFRGRAAERAQAHGAVGAIFYADPQDDGDARGLTAPDGPWRPAGAVDRGWVGTEIRIPVLPVSAENAQVLLGALRGPAAPPAWVGALPVPYPLARGPGRVHLAVKLDRRTLTLWNVVGTVPGVHGDESVVIGAHRDAWTYGAAGAGSGIASVVEVGRGLGFLLGGGWRPERTIVLAGWDAGELGDAGARTFVERHHDDLARGCLGYLDADRSVTGPDLAVGATPALWSLIADAARSVRDPLSPAANLLRRWTQAGSRDARPDVAADDEPFAQIRAPRAHMVFRGPFGVANSAYDTAAHAARVGDPDFALNRAAAQLDGIVLLRLAGAGQPPYVFAGYTALLRAAGPHPQAGAPGAAALRRAIARYAAAAAHYDRAAEPLGGTSRADAALQAVRDLDRLIAADPAGAAGAFDAAHIDAGAQQTADAVDRITAELVR